MNGAYVTITLAAMGSYYTEEVLPEDPRVGMVDSTQHLIIQRLSGYTDTLVTLIDNPSLVCGTDQHVGATCAATPGTSDCAFSCVGCAGGLCVECEPYIEAACTRCAEHYTVVDQECWCAEEGYPPLDNGDCYNGDCRLDEYVESSATGNLGCRSCSDECLSCRDYDHCISCYRPANIDTELGKCVCPEGQYNSRGNCIPIGTVECPLGTYSASNDGEHCEDCVDFCEACNSTQCLECQWPRKVPDCVCPIGWEVEGDECRCDRDQGFFIELDDSCVHCDSSCITCHGPADTDCELCGKNAKLQANGTCVCVHPDLVLSVDGDCTEIAVDAACDPVCKECEGDKVTCIECGVAPYLIDGRCRCDEGFYFEYELADCIRCDRSCAGCSRYDSCDTCKEGAFLDSGSCFCMENHEMNTDGDCAPIHINDNCGLYQYVSDLKICEDCQKPCKTCYNGDRRGCATCTENAKLAADFRNPTMIETGECKCEREFFMNEVGECHHCPGACDSCTGSDPTDCTSCVEGAVEVSGGCQCQTGFTLFDHICVVYDGVCEYDLYETVTGCEPCAFPCVSCTGSPTSCTACQFPYELNGDSCVCRDGFFLEGTECHQCHASCLKCMGPGETDCTECAVTRELNMGKCPCTDDAIYNEMSSLCFVEHTDCGDDHYRGNDDYCHPCHQSCMACTGPSRHECKECRGDSRLIVSISPEYGECLCEQRQYMDDYGDCGDCHVSCLSCYGTLATQCSECSDISELAEDETGSWCRCREGFKQNSQGICGEEKGSCLMGKYDDGTACRACAEDCATCSGGSGFCTACFPGQHLEEGKCRCDNLASYKAGAWCLHCPLNCARCAEDGTCLECSEFSEEYEGECHCLELAIKNRGGECTLQGTSQSCAFDMYLDAEDNMCKYCDYNCRTCSETKHKCASCWEGFEKNEHEECVCAAGLFKEDDECRMCAPACAKCLGPDPEDCLECAVPGVPADDCKCGEFDQWDFDEFECVPLRDNDECVYWEYLAVTTDGSSTEEDEDCLLCSHSCRSCVGPHEDDCLSCHKGSNFTFLKEIHDLRAGNCSDCLEGQFLDWDYGQCAMCPRTCRSCLSGDFCVECVEEAEYTLSNTCECRAPYETNMNDTGNACIVPDWDICGGSGMRHSPSDGAANADGCVPCSPGCLACDDTDCLLCNGTDNIVSGDCIVCLNPNCLCVTPDGCDVCEDPHRDFTTNCVNCESGFIEFGGVCEPDTGCPAGQFLNETMCEPCDGSCDRCLGPTQHDCSGCRAPMILEFSECICPHGFFHGAGDCLACSASCSECYSGADQCQSCAPGFIRDNEEYRILDGYETFKCRCPINTFGENGVCEPLNFNPTCSVGQYENAPGSCEDCTTPCTSCMNAASTCLSCEVGYEVYEQGDGTVECVLFCPEGKFLDGASCSPCPMNCVECSSGTECLGCLFPLTLMHPSTDCLCNSIGWSLDGSECIFTANDTCREHAFTEADDSCTPCEDKFTGGKLCFDCNETDCIACDLYNREVLDTGECRCADEHYRTSEGWCIECGVNCVNCDKDGCIACRETFYAIDPHDPQNCICDKEQAFEDFPECWLYTPTTAPAPGNYNTADGDKPCHSICAECIGPKDYLCTECATGFDELEPDLHGLVECKCPKGTFLIDGVCTGTCHETCQKCYGPSIEECDQCVDFAAFEVDGFGDKKCECLDGFEWHDTTKECVPVSSELCSNYTLFWDFEDESCKPCDPSCWSCWGPEPDDCLTCRIEFEWKIVPEGMTCDCPGGTFFDEAGTCLDCPPKCDSCHFSTGNLICDRCSYLAEFSATNECACVQMTQEVGNHCEATPSDDRCGPEQYYDPIAEDCFPCEGCHFCFEFGCEICSNGKTLNIDSDPQTCECPSGTFEAGFWCEGCSVACNECDGPSNYDCHSCNATGLFIESHEGACVCQAEHYYNEYNQSCMGISTLTIGEYTDANNSPQPCDTSCKHCIGPHKHDCVSCNENSDLHSKETVDGRCMCHKGYFFNNQNCQECHFTCSDCNGPSDTDCIECAPTLIYMCDLDFCKCECEIGYHYDDAVKYCVAESIDKCELGFYESDSEFCQKCDENCATCLGPNEDQCVGCWPGAKLRTVNLAETSSGYCECEHHLYLHISEPTSFCEECHESCAECKGNSDTDCVECFGDHYRGDLLRDVSICSCEDGFIFDSDEMSCLPQGSTEMCDHNEYFDVDNEECAPCNIACLTCDGETANDCLLCSENREHHSSGTCKCADGFFTQEINSVESLCVPCHNNCNTCSAPGSDSCIECAFNFEEVTNECICLKTDTQFYDEESGQCINLATAPCSEGEGLTEDKHCVPCKNPRCSSCIARDEEECTQCRPDMQKLEGPEPYKFMCECPPDTYFDEKDMSCRSCDKSCAKCYGPHEYNCEECRGQYRIEHTDKGQECHCPEGYVEGATDCIPAATSDFCETNQYEDDSGICRPCSPQCANCIGPDSDHCVACGANSTRIDDDDFGVCECDKEYFREGDFCIDCMANCRTCIDGTACETCPRDRESVDIDPTCATCKPGLIANSSEAPYVSCAYPHDAANCPIGQYQNSTGGCNLCSEKCYSCSVGGSAKCLSCDYEMFELQNREIIDSVVMGSCVCYEGTYYEKDRKECLRCHEQCETCNGPESYQCLSCWDNASEKNTNQGTICECNSGLVWSEHDRECIDPTSCETDEFFDEESGLCRFCDEICLTCHGPSDYDCETCKFSLILDPQMSHCVCSESGKFFSHKTESCQTCRSKCTECVNKEECTSCIQNAELRGTPDGEICECIHNYEYNPDSKTCEKMFTSLSTDCFGDRCSNCWGEFEGECIYCKGNQELIIYEEFEDKIAIGTCVCPEWSFWSGTVCDSCLPHCLHCNSISTCQTCDIYREFNGVACSCKSAFIEEGDNCVIANSGCEPGRFLRADGTCGKCHETCELCKDSKSSECLTCSSQFHFEFFPSPVDPEIGSCVCEPGYFLGEGMCMDCDSTCETCSGGEEHECLSCRSTALLEEPGTSSRCRCDIDYQMNEDTGECLEILTDSSCSEICESCTANGECVTCAFREDDEGECLCEHSKFFNYDTAACEACEATCEDCYGTSSHCTACGPFAYLIIDATGVFCMCESDFVQSTSGECILSSGSSPNCGTSEFEEDGSCKECHEMCLSCDGPAAEHCLRCIWNADYTETGACMCEESFYFDNECRPCDWTCRTCSAEAVCTSCDESRRTLSATGKCECKTGFKPEEGSHECVPENGCDVNEFLEEDENDSEGEGKCRQCYKHCLTCTGPLATDCSGCDQESDFIQTASGKCECKDGFYLEDDYCEKCHPSCATCEEFEDCLTCQHQATINEIDQSCACNPDHYWSDELEKCVSLTMCSNGYPTHDGCEPCDPSCDSCTGPEDYDCLACPATSLRTPTYNLDRVQRYFCQCRENFFYEEGVCHECHQTCKSCHESPEATDCEECHPYAHFTEIGVDDWVCECNPYFSQDTDGRCNPIPVFENCALFRFEAPDSNCYDCPSLCVTCFSDDANSCLSCIDGAKLSVEEQTTEFAVGYCECPEGTWTDHDSDSATFGCNECDLACKNCYGKGPEACYDCSNYFSPVEGAAPEMTICACDFENDPCEPPIDKTCGEGEFLALNGCEKCHTLCQSCEGEDSNHCLSCYAEEDRVLIKTNQKDSGTCVCRKGLYNADGECMKCHPTCETCMGNAETDCLSCYELGNPNAEGKCLCEPGKIWSDLYQECIIDSGCTGNTFNDISGECIACSQRCNGCVYTENYACIDCADATFEKTPSKITDLTIDVFNCRCPPGKFFDSGTCTDCDPECSQCTLDATNCLECSDHLRVLRFDNGVGHCECIENYEENASGNCELISFYEGCTSGQFKNDNDLCIDCHVTCAACNAEGPDACIVCKPGSFLEDSSCTAKHRFVFDEDISEFVQCPDNCETCISTGGIVNCELCYEGYFFTAPGCDPCPEECLACDITGCTHCQQSQVLDMNTCKCTEGHIMNEHGDCEIKEFGDCGENSYRSDNNDKCKHCHEDCASCIGGDREACLACDYWDGRELVELDRIVDTHGEERAVGECKCREGHSLVEGECIKCWDTCKKCSGPAHDDCKECHDSASETHISPDGVRKECECNIGFYPAYLLNDPAAVGCILVSLYAFTDRLGRQRSCHHTCYECNEASEWDCLSCSVGRSVEPDHETGECRCNAGYDDGSGNCVTDCAPLCEVCFGPGETECLECVLNASADEGPCECDDNYEVDDPTNPTMCSAIKPFDVCTLTEYIAADGTCQPCDSSCQTCFDAGPENCLTCDSSSSSLEELGEDPTIGYCFCYEGLYRNEVSQCMECPAGCDSCYLDAGTALPVCDKCEEHRSMPNCTCSAGFVDNVGSCVLDTSISDCDPGFYPNVDCNFPCHSSCFACVDVGAESCVACTDKKVLEELHDSPGYSVGKCMCPMGSFLHDGQCKHCEFPCNDCSATECRGCHEEGTTFELVAGACKCTNGLEYSEITETCVDLSSCPSGEAFSVIENNCVPCHERCSTCAAPGSKECTGCTSGLVPASATTTVFECICPGEFEFYKNNTCFDCSDENAHIDDSGTTKTCICDEGYIIDAASTNTELVCRPDESACPNSNCSSCHPLCETCSVEADATACTLCAATAVELEDADLSNGITCGCGSTTGYDSPKEVCMPCIDSLCHDCAQDTGVCVDCKEGSEPGSSGNCACKFGFTQNGAECDPPAGTAGCEFDEYPKSTATGETTCKSCHSSCFTCSGDTEFDCTSCGENTNPPTNGICTCSSGFYLSLIAENCRACEAPCVECTDSPTKCTACKPDIEVVNAADTCECATGYELVGANCELIEGDCGLGQFGTTGNCANCDPACLSCTDIGNDNCLLCDPAFNKNSTGACVMTCDGICKTCEGTTSNCLTCNEGNGAFDANNATAIVDCQCLPGYYLDTSVNSCTLIPSCSDKQYFSLTSLNCQNCNELCVTCSGSAHADCDTCVDNAGKDSGLCECDTDFHYDESFGYCVANPICPDGTFMNSIFECQSCDISCSTCTGASDNECTACKQGITLTVIATSDGVSRGFCLCEDGTYYDKDTGNCLACSDECSTCSGLGADKCILCSTGYINILGTCECDVNNGFFAVTTGTTTVCSPCHSSCANCQGGNNDDCFTCKEKHILVQAGVMTSTKPGICNCAPDYYYDSSSASCISKPAAANCLDKSTFVNGEACEDCESSCRECKGAVAGDCTVCAAGYFFTYGGTDLISSADLTGTCTCSSLSSGVCSTGTCPDGYFLDNSEPQKEPVCRQCASTCATCVGEAPSDCVMCADNYRRASPKEANSDCECREQYFDSTKDICYDVMPVNTIGDCPLSFYACELSGPHCAWASDGQLQNPTNEQCLALIYDYCCTHSCNIGVSFKSSICSDIDVPGIRSSKFNTDGTEIKIRFDSKTQMSNNDCSLLFANSGILGDAECYLNEWDSKKLLTIYLWTDSTIKAGDSLTFYYDSYKSNDDYAQTWNTMNTVTISAPNDAEALEVEVFYPDQLSSCEPSTFLWAQLTTGATGTIYTWTITGASFRLVEANGAAIELSGYSSSAQVDVSVAASTNIAASIPLSFLIPVTQEAVPIIVVPFDRMKFSIDETVWLEFWVELDFSICSFSSISYEWVLEETDDADFTLAQYLIDGYSFIWIPPYSLRSNKSYKLSARARLDNGEWGSKTVTFKTKVAELDILLLGGNRDISILDSVSIDSGLSIDPDDVLSTDRSDWQYTWTCEDWTSMNKPNPLYSYGINTDVLDEDFLAEFEEFQFIDCTTEVLGGSTSAATGVLTLLENTLAADKFYYFKLAVLNNNAARGTGYSWVRTSAEAVHSIYIENSMKYLNATSINRLKAVVNTDDPSPTLQWSLLTTGLKVDWKSGTNGKRVSFRIDESTVDYSAIYSFQCTLSTSDGKSNSAIVELSVNRPPSGGQAKVEPTTGTLDTDFTVTFSDWTDKEGNLPIKYIVKVHYPEGSDEKPKKIIWGTGSLIEGVKIPFKSKYDYVDLEFLVRDGLRNTNTLATRTRITRIQQTTAELETSLFNTLASYSDIKDSLSKQGKLNRLTSFTIGFSELESLDAFTEDVAEVIKSIINECTLSEQELGDELLSQCITGISASASTDDSQDYFDATQSILDGLLIIANELEEGDLFSLLDIIGSSSLSSRRRLLEGDLSTKEYSDLLRKQEEMIMKLSEVNYAGMVPGSETAATSNSSSYTAIVTSRDLFTSDLYSVSFTGTKSTNAQTLDLPKDSVPNSNDIQCSVWTEESIQLPSNVEQSSSSYMFNCRDGGGTALFQNAECAEYIHFTMEFDAGDTLHVPNEGVWMTNGSSFGYYADDGAAEENWVEAVNLTEFSASCVFWDYTTEDWSSAGINNTKTYIEWSTSTIHCYTCHFSTFSSQSETVTSSSESLSPYDALDEFNAIYLTASFSGLGLIFIVLGAVIQKTRKEEKIHVAQSEAPQPSAGEHPKGRGSENVMFNNMIENGVMGETQLQNVRGKDEEETAVDRPEEFLRFMKMHLLYTGYFVRDSASYPCYIRAAAFFSLCVLEILLVGVLLDQGNSIGLGALVWLCSLALHPMIAFLYFVPTILSGALRVAKIIVTLLITAAVAGLCIMLSCAYVEDLEDEEENNKWVYGALIALGLQFVATEGILTLLKYFMVKLFRNFFYQF